MPGKLVGPASRLVGGLGKEHIHGVIAWQPYHSGVLVFDLTLVRKPKRDWCGATTETDWDHWRRPCSSGRLWALASLTRLFTAVCVSIDRIPQNMAPICCLSFDEIGARHPGMTHDAGAKSSVRSSFPLSCHPQKPRVYPPRELRLTNNTSDWKANGEIRFQTC
jgi:hypothetical protein